MKKIQLFLLSLFMVTSLASCGGEDNSKKDENSSGEVQITEKTKPVTEDSTPEETEPDAEEEPKDDWQMTEDESSADTDITGKTFADVSYANYSQMIKRDFGIEVSEDDGWEISFPSWDVMPFMDSGISVHTYYTGTDIKKLMQTYYDRCAEVASNGMWDYNYIWYTHDDPLNEENLKTLDQCLDSWNSDEADINVRCDVRWAYTYNDQIVFFWIERVSENAVDIKIQFRSED